MTSKSPLTRCQEARLLLQFQQRNKSEIRETSTAWSPRVGWRVRVPSQEAGKDSKEETLYIKKMKNESYDNKVRMIMKYDMVL